MRNLKIALSILFILSVSFFVVRTCVHKKPFAYRIEKPSPIIKKKITYKKIESVKEETVKQSVEEITKAPRLAVILDDWGYQASLINLAIDIDRPITLAVLPHLPYSTRVAQKAFNQGLGVMLHMPMQPKNKWRGLERHTILVTDKEEVIKACLDSALTSVPHVEGVNNHMGSLATSDERVMRIVLSHLMSKGLFFIDSNTAPATVSPKISRELGIKFAKRDIFIDNEMVPESIKKQLRQAEKLALRTGRAVAIGHGKKMTILVIKEMVPEIEKAGIKLVLVRDLVK